MVFKSLIGRAFGRSSQVTEGNSGSEHSSKHSSSISSWQSISRFSGKLSSRTSRGDTSSSRSSGKSSASALEQGPRYEDLEAGTAPKRWRQLPLVGRAGIPGEPPPLPVEQVTHSTSASLGRANASPSLSEESGSHAQPAGPLGHGPINFSYPRRSSPVPLADSTQGRSKELAAQRESAIWNTYWKGRTPENPLRIDFGRADSPSSSPRESVDGSWIVLEKPEGSGVDHHVELSGSDVPPSPVHWGVATTTDGAVPAPLTQSSPADPGASRADQPAVNASSTQPGPSVASENLWRDQAHGDERSAKDALAPIRAGALSAPAPVRPDPGGSLWDAIDAAVELAWDEMDTDAPDTGSTASGKELNLQQGPKELGTAAFARRKPAPNQTPAPYGKAIAGPTAGASLAGGKEAGRSRLADNLKLAAMTRKSRDGRASVEHARRQAQEAIGPGAPASGPIAPWTRLNARLTKAYESAKSAVDRNDFDAMDVHLRALMSIGASTAGNTVPNRSAELRGLDRAYTQARSAVDALEKACGSSRAPAVKDLVEKAIKQLEKLHRGGMKCINAADHSGVRRHVAALSALQRSVSLRLDGQVGAARAKWQELPAAALQAIPEEGQGSGAQQLDATPHASPTDDTFDLDEILALYGYDDPPRSEQHSDASASA